MHVPIGEGRSYGSGSDLTLVTFGNGLRMSLRVARRLADVGVGARVFDLRWLAPAPAAYVVDSQIQGSFALAAQRGDLRRR